MNRGMIKSSREPSARPAQGLIEYTLPEKPASRLQVYRLTEQGRAGSRSKSGESYV